MHVTYTHISSKVVVLMSHKSGFNFFVLCSMSCSGKYDSMHLHLLNLRLIWTAEFLRITAYVIAWFFYWFSNTIETFWPMVVGCCKRLNLLWHDYHFSRCLLTAAFTLKLVLLTWNVCVIWFHVGSSRGMYESTARLSAAILHYCNHRIVQL